MLDFKTFEKNVYASVNREVNRLSSALLENNGATKTNAVQFQREIIRTLHGVTEEIAVQNLYGLITLIEVKYRKAKPIKPPAEIFEHQGHLFEKVTWDDVSAIFVCKNCKKGFMHHYGKNGDDFHKSASASKAGKEPCSH